MTRVPFLPNRHELAALRERWDREDAADVPLNDFDTTLTSGIEGTINQLGLFQARSGHTVESANTQLAALTQLKDEVANLLKAHAALVQTVNTKASKATVRKFEADLTAKHVRSVDNLKWIVGAVGTILGVLVAIKGHT